MVGGIVKIYIGPFLFLNGMHMRLINCSQINTHLLILGLGNACLLPKLAKKKCIFIYDVLPHCEEHMHAPISQME